MPAPASTVAWRSCRMIGARRCMPSMPSAASSMTSSTSPAIPPRSAPTLIAGAPASPPSMTARPTTSSPANFSAPRAPSPSAAPTSRPSSTACRPTAKPPRRPGLADARPLLRPRRLRRRPPFRPRLRRCQPRSRRGCPSSWTGVATHKYPPRHRRGRRSRPLLPPRALFPGARAHDRRRSPRPPQLPDACARLAVDAHARFADAARAMDRCDPTAMRAARLMGATYAEILRALERRGWRDLDRKVSVPLCWRARRATLSPGHEHRPHRRRRPRRPQRRHRPRWPRPPRRAA